MTTPHCVQINLQQGFGGGEVYTRFVCRALVELGWRVDLLVSENATAWHGFALPGLQLRPIGAGTRITSQLPASPSPVVTHTAIDSQLALQLAGERPLGGYMHMPLYERLPGSFSNYSRLFGVSQYVIDSALSRGLVNVHPEPQYGVADLSTFQTAQVRPLQKHSEYAWDQRKVRDRLLGVLERQWRPLRPSLSFSRKPGFSLGVVSRITPIKQFPALFSCLLPVLLARPDIKLEIFGAGGYASVRDLKRVLAPIAQRVRFWGHQSDMRSVYANLDCVLSGLPEKEALGLNLIEAQACGVSVLAVNAPPFTETVEHEHGGFLYTDPRLDQAQDFSRQLDRLVRQQSLRDDRAQKTQASLAMAQRFSWESFKQRTERAMQALIKR